MKFDILKCAVLLLAGFGAGVLVSNLSPSAMASTAQGETNLSQKSFHVFINEIRQNFVFGDKFSGHYTKTITLSDGTSRSLELTPMIHEGMQVVEFKDNNGRTYMGLNGTTTNGTLMVEISDDDTQRKLLKTEGWPVSDR